LYNKILKKKKVAELNIFEPDFSPIKDPKFKSVLKIEIEPPPNVNNKPKVDEQIKQQLKELEKKIYEQSYKKGYDKGYTKGYEEGYKEGLEKGEKEGFQNGFNKGYNEGKLKAEKEYQILKEALEKDYNEKLKQIDILIKNFNEELKNLVIDLDDQVFFLAKKIAEKIVLKTIKTDKEFLTNLIREALKYVAEGVKVKVKVNPEDYTMLKEKTDFNYKGEIIIIPDKSVKRGGVLIESSVGTVDATLEKRWEKLLKALENEN